MSYQNERPTDPTMADRIAALRLSMTLTRISTRISTRKDAGERQ